MGDRVFERLGDRVLVWGLGDRFFVDGWVIVIFCG